MSNSLHISLLSFPFSNLPNTPQEYYEKIRLVKFRENKDVFDSVEKVQAMLETDDDFKDFWNMHSEDRRVTKWSLSRWALSRRRSRPEDLFREYQNFLMGREWSDISMSARMKNEAKFNALRPSLYQSFLEKEAVRLNCDASEVRPITLVLPLQEDGKQSKLCFLPPHLLAKIMARLNTFEIFQVSLVCKKWREIVYKDPSVLRRAEHSLNTHLLTFTSWMNPSNVVQGFDFIRHHWSFGWGLMNWCCSISQNLQTLVLLDFNRSDNEVMHLLRQCPNLKHLHLKTYALDGTIETDLHLPKLETLITENSIYFSASKFGVHLLTMSSRLQVFKGHIEREDMIFSDVKRLNQDAFANLIALQLGSISSELVESLATLDQLQLRYLYLWDTFRLSQFQDLEFHQSIDEQRNAFNCLLSKQTQLEVLVSLWKLDLDENTIKLMTEHQRNLKSALLSFRFTSLENEGSLESMDGRDHIDNQDALALFEEMLLESDSSRDLSNFVFLVKDERTMSFLEDAMTGFSIYQDSDEYSDLFEKWSLSYPPMRKQLGIEF